MRSNPMRVLLIVVVVAVSTACASSGAVPQPFPTAAKAPASAPEAGAEGGAAALDVTVTAMALRGTPYRNGGADPNGFDCSGFVRYVFGQHGLPMPRTVEEQYEVGGRVKPDELQPGDLVFFRTAGRGASHVGIALGDDAFVHAPSSSGVVRVEQINSDYWGSRFIGARRVGR
jgi:cell wall-associated NlpC family hydrolase